MRAFECHFTAGRTPQIELADVAVVPENDNPPNTMHVNVTASHAAKLDIHPIVIAISSAFAEYFDGPERGLLTRCRPHGKVRHTGRTFDFDWGR